jgi:hypothetical protein
MNDPVRYNLSMRHTTTASGEQLANALHALGVHFIRGGKADAATYLRNHPARLIAALAQSKEARLRLSLIPLFLEHPEYASRVRGVAKKLDPAARITLECYYTAALWLAKKYGVNVSLPDHFFKVLNLTLAEDPDENLRALAKRHSEMSDSYVNWLATYRHAEQIWRKGFERRKKAVHG